MRDSSEEERSRYHRDGGKGRNEEKSRRRASALHRHALVHKVCLPYNWHDGRIPAPLPGANAQLTKRKRPQGSTTFVCVQRGDHDTAKLMRVLMKEPVLWLL